MTSTVRSDISRPTSYFNARAGSAGSVVDHLTNAKHVTQLSAVIGNGARDSALQINGHVTDRITNLNFKYLIIPCHCEVIGAIVSTKGAPRCSATVPPRPPLPVPAKLSAQLNAVSPLSHLEPPPQTDQKITSAEISSLFKRKQNKTLISVVTGQLQPFYVIFPRHVQDNFISLELVTRLGLEKHFHIAAVSSITWDSRRLSSTGDFVYIPFPIPGRAKSKAQCFLVLQDCPFDMLQGTAAIDS